MIVFVIANMDCIQLFKNAYAELQAASKIDNSKLEKC